MSDADPLLLLTSKRTSRHQTVYGGICLNDRFASNLFESEWNGYLFGDEPVGIHLIHHQTDFSHVNARPNSYWEFDGNALPDETDGREMMHSLACNGFSELKFSPPRELALPQFVGPDPKLRPCRYDLTVKLVPQCLLGIPDVVVELDTARAVFPRPKQLHDERRNQLESTRPFAGLTLPVEVSRDGRIGAGVLHLRAEEEPGIFRCRLYWSDRTIRIEKDSILRRHARRELKAKIFHNEGDIAVIVDIGDAALLGAEDVNEGIVTKDLDGRKLPIVCTGCSREFDPAQFGADQLEIIDLWGWLWPLRKEKSLLLRVLAMYSRFPEAKGKIANKHDAIMSTDGVFEKMLLENLTYDQVPDPRSSDYAAKLDHWTQGDDELRYFLEHTSCDIDQRLEMTQAEEAKWEAMLKNRTVACPVCGASPVAIKTWRDP